MGVVGLYSGILATFVARYPTVGATWPAAYVQFLVGTTTLSVELLLGIVFLLFPVALLHAVYNDAVGFLTFGPAVILLRFGPVVPVDSGVVPVIGLFVSGSVPIPIWAAVITVAAAWNIDERLATEAGEPPSDTEQPKHHSAPWLRFGGVLGGYTLVGACCLVGVERTVGVLSPPAAVPGIAFLAFGAVVLEFVSTRSLVGTGTLAAGAWTTGLAGLQYDGVVPGVAIPVAVLLTLAAGGLWLDRRGRPWIDLDTLDSLRKS